MEIKIAIAKIDKFGSGISGDTAEVIERPNGGLSVVLADGQMDDQDNKAISTMVSHRIIEHISTGARDSSAVRAASNNIFVEYGGRVQANLNILSVDLQSNTILVSRNSPIPVFLIRDEIVDVLTCDCEPIGGHADISPTIVELEISPGTAIILLTDGVYNAGSGNQTSLDFGTILEALFDEQEPTAKEIADFLLNRAIRLDDGRPKDDMSVVVMLITAEPTDHIRRMSVTMSLEEKSSDLSLRGPA